MSSGFGYRENDKLGGEDPYSASKGCAELMANIYEMLFSEGDTYITDKNPETLLEVIGLKMELFRFNGCWSQSKQ